MSEFSSSAFGEQILKFYSNLKPPQLPDGIQPLLPFRNPEVRLLMEAFYGKFFNDDHERILLFGINPGRLGAGITGIGFTDPIRFREACGISHQLELKPELSSVFIYEMIAEFGGPNVFYKHFHFTVVSPIGYVSNGLNVNYYDTPELRQATASFILNSIRAQLKMPVNRRIAFSVGKGQNYKYLIQINKEHRFFERIVALPHPRWVMQYQYNHRSSHVAAYLKLLGNSIT